MIVLLALQAAVAGPVLPTPRPLPSAGDRPCPVTQAGDDIVVCGRANDDAFRLKPLPARFATARGLPGADIALPGNVKAAAAVESASVGGAPSNRVMLRLKRPF